jgi:hypothetical protein
MTWWPGRGFARMAGTDALTLAVREAARPARRTPAWVGSHPPPSTAEPSSTREEKP